MKSIPSPNSSRCASNPIAPFNRIASVMKHRQDDDLIDFDLKNDLVGKTADESESRFFKHDGQTFWCDGDSIQCRLNF